MLILEDVSTYYSKIQVLRGISLKVAEGEIVVILGANGSGKTTTVNTISSLVHPREGEVLFRGESIKNLQPEQISMLGIAHVPQGAGIFQRMSVLENLELGGSNVSKKELEKNMCRIFKFFPRLEERKKQLAGTLSGGERQMLAIGRALISVPKLLILDEPSFGLSPLLVREIAVLIRQLRDEGVTILLVEQNVRMALSIADRGYILEVGEILLQDIASALVKNEYVRKAYLGI